MGLLSYILRRTKHRSSCTTPYFRSDDVYETGRHFSARSPCVQKFVYSDRWRLTWLNVMILVPIPKESTLRSVLCSGESFSLMHRASAAFSIVILGILESHELVLALPMVLMEESNDVKAP